MKFTPVVPPRVFEAGHGVVQIKDCGQVHLKPDEQVTFITDSGGEYDVVRKSWGFYATPSLNRRLQRFDLRGVLVKNTAGAYFVWLVERGKETDCEHYMASEGIEIIHWLDSTEQLESLEQRVRNG
jgi:hypothetical protein